MTEKSPTLAERLAAVEATLQMHVRSCDRKGSIAIALLGIVLAATLTGTGVLLHAALHLGG